MVVSPEHPYLDKYKDDIKNWDEIESYREQASRKSDFERAELAKDKTGVHNRIMSHCANVSSTAGAATSTIPSATAALTGSRCLLVAVI